MFDAFLQFEPEMRLAAFGGTLIAILLWEFLATKRPSEWRFERTLTHLLLMIVNSLALRLVMPILAFELALHVRNSSTVLQSTVTNLVKKSSKKLEII